MNKKLLCGCLLSLFALSAARAQTVPASMAKGDLVEALYIGIDNPVSLYLPISEWDSLDLQMSNGSIEHAGDNHYLIRVNEPGQATLSVRYHGRQLGQFPFRARRVPDPVPVLAGASVRKNTVLTAAEFHELRGLGMWLDNFDFDARCSTAQYTLIRIDSAGQRSSVHNLGPRFEEPARKLVAQAQAGDIYLFTDLEANCAGEPANRQLNNYTILVK